LNLGSCLFQARPGIENTLRQVRSIRNYPSISISPKVSWLALFRNFGFLGFDSMENNVPESHISVCPTVSR